jgi:hypothetical protein
MMKTKSLENHQIMSKSMVNMMMGMMMYSHKWRQLFAD